MMINIFFLSLQIYFLAVLFNILAGLILCSDNIKEKIPALSGLMEFLSGKEVRKVIGIGTLIAGIFKLMLPVGVPFLGDFIPAITSMGLGIALLLEIFKENSSISSERIQKLDDMLSTYKNTIGGIGIFVAVVHFFFAAVPFLL